MSLLFDLGMKPHRPSRVVLLRTNDKSRALSFVKREIDYAAILRIHPAVVLIASDIKG
jgi:hypothetical protein